MRAHYAEIAAMREHIPRLRSGLQYLLQDEGQDLVEYAFVIALLALGATASLRSLAGTLDSTFAAIGTVLATAA
jgi:pilus assembly protein Flp/PilA